MKKTILGVLTLKLLNGGGPAMRGHTDQMVPAENLMQDNSIREAAEPQAKDHACPNQRMF